MNGDITINYITTSERTCKMRRKVEKEDEQIQFQSNKVSINAKIIPLQESLFIIVAPFIEPQELSPPQEFS
jgi:hypothetical protein